MTHDYMKSMIGYLLNRRDFVSGQELSEALGVSTKTINRTVKQINESSEEIPIIESQRGRGYRLNFQNYFNQQDRMDHANAMNGISSVERRDEIIKRLLITSPHQYRVDDTGAKVVVLLTVGANGDGSNEHLRLLSPLARKMAKQEVTAALRQAQSADDDIKIETQGTIGMAFGGTSQDALVTGEFNFWQSLATLGDKAPGMLPVIIATGIAFSIAGKPGIAPGFISGLGADLTLTEEFLNIGLDELSVSPTSVLPLKEEIRKR